MNFKKYIKPNKSGSKLYPLLSNKKVFCQLIDELGKLSTKEKIDKVVCIEGKGFVLGSAVAYKKKLGVVLLRQSGKLKADKYSVSYTDYTGKKKKLELPKEVIKRGERVLLIDDWVDTGETVKAAIGLIKKSGGVIVGINVFMDDIKNEKVEKFLSNYNYRFIEKTEPNDPFF